MGVRVLKFDGAVAPRVLKFDSGYAAEGCGGAYELIEGASLYKTFTTALAGEEMHSPLVAGATTLPGGKHVTGFAGRLQLPYESSSFATPSSRGHYGCLAMEPYLCRKA